MRRIIGCIFVLVIAASCRYEPPKGFEARASSGSGAAFEETMPLRLGEGITPPEVLKRVKPDFARCTGETLSVRSALEVVVDEGGFVRDAHMITPVSPCMERVILSSIRESRFRPAKLDGRPVAVVFNITVLAERR